MPLGCPERLQEFLVHWSWGEQGGWPVAFFFFLLSLGVTISELRH